MPFDLDMFQERKDKRRIKLFNLQRRGLPVEPRSGESDEQLKCISERLTGVHARAPITRQMFTQKHCQMNRERAHDDPPWCNASPTWAICRIRPGVACRYQ